ncbi:class I tRNA ligase family protein [Sphingomonas sp. 3-13AW]
MYEKWEADGAFKPSGTGTPFFIPMPPPNITGRLHMGHALFSTIQDTTIRYARMRGHQALWLPGFDHAGLATQAKLDAEMIAAGLDPEGPSFEPFAEAYRRRLGGEIETQLRRTGASCDWSRRRFTMDEGYTRAVEAAFDICRSRDMLYRDGEDWYLRMDGLAARLLSELDAGNLEIQPARGEAILREFLRNIEPWCISRQIRWGHRIPIEGETAVLDTWFSSALWPFATLGWPADTPDMRRFYPATLIETGDDILFFWCARMLMMGLLLTDTLPFTRILMHGIVRDAEGRKMSKSLGNGIDPLGIIDKYGSDGMRIALLEGCAPGTDLRIRDERLQAGRGFTTKLWNIGRFALSHLEEGNSDHEDDRELIRRASATRRSIGEAIEAFDLHLAAAAARRFLFDDLSSWWIEVSKDRLRAGDASAKACITQVLDRTLRMFHPITPFVTEELRSAIGGPPLITSSW